MLEGKDLIGHKVILTDECEISDFVNRIITIRGLSERDNYVYSGDDGYSYNRNEFMILTDTPLGRIIYGQD